MAASGPSYCLALASTPPFPQETHCDFEPVLPGGTADGEISFCGTQILSHHEV